MHEVGTVLYVIRTVENICEQNDLNEVASVTLEIGEVSGILPEFLMDCWQWAILKTRYMQKAELKVEPVEAVTYCENCQSEYETVKYAKICPHCGSDRTYLIQGNEYNIKEIEVR